MRDKCNLIDIQLTKLPRTGLIALGLFAFLAVLTFSRFPSILPAYPAVIVGFGCWCVLPGWFLQRALFATKSTGVVERFAIAFLMSMAVASVPGLIALRLHWSIEGFGLAYAAAAGLASGLSLVMRSERVDVTDAPGDEVETSSRSGPFPTAVLLALIAIPLLAILTSPWWEDGRVARDADDVVYATYVGEYQEKALDASEPFADTKRGAFGRMQFNVWVVVQGLLAHSTGVEAISLLHVHLPPIMALLVVASLFALARGLFRENQIALLACVLLVAYGGLDLSPHEGFGRNIFLRIGEDKMVASFIMLPLGLLLSARYLERRDVRAYLGTLTALAALFVTHPMSLMFLAATLATLALLRVNGERTAASLFRNGILVAPWAVAGIGLFLTSTLGAGRVYQIGETFRRSFHLVDLPGNQIVGSYHLILHPFVLIAVLVAPALWILNRRLLGSQILLASVVTSLAIMYIPPVATVLADVVNEEVVWRAHWIIPVPLAIAYALYTVASKIPPSGLQLAGIRLSQRVAPLVILFMVFGGAFLVQEQYANADNGAYYNRISHTALFPWTDGSITLGGIERAFSSEWRPPPTEAALLEYLKEHAPPGSTVLMPPTLSDRFFPAVLRDIQSVNAPEALNRQFREAFVHAFYDGRLDEIAPGRDVEMMLDDFSVDYVVVPPRTELDDELRRFASFDPEDFVVELGEPELIAYLAPTGDELSAWAFDVRGEERIGGVQFTIPADMDPSRPTLEFVLETAPAENVAADAVVRLVVTYFPASGGEPTSVVTDIPLEEGMRRGQRIITRRPVSVTVEAGTDYSFIVSRLPNDSEDVDEDVLLTSLVVKYWSTTGYVPIGGTGFYIYER